MYVFFSLFDVCIRWFLRYNDLVLGKFFFYFGLSFGLDVLMILRIWYYLYIIIEIRMILLDNVSILLVWVNLSLIDIFVVGNIVIFVF